jgi:putative transposase
LLQAHLADRAGCSLSITTLTRLIDDAGFVWCRPKLALKQDDPLAEQRARAIAEAIAEHPMAPRLFEDECEMHQVPVIRGQYQKRMEQRTIATPGNSCRQPIFGFLNTLTGQWHYWMPQRKRSVEFVACLHELHQVYTEGPILLFLDNASIHKSKLTLRWLENHPRFIVRYLPAYSGHQTNPVEKIWWALKNDCAANRMYECRHAIQDAIAGHFAWMKPEHFIKLTNRTKPNSNKPVRVAI